MREDRGAVRFVAFLLAVVAALAAAGCGGSRHATAVSTSACGPVEYSGTGKPTHLIVSDLPLLAPPGAREQVAGIRYVLGLHHYRAGSYTVGYQSCDDSSAAAGHFDTTVCSANAKAYAADTSVVGVIGPYNSDCAAVEIPQLEKADHGPVAIIGTATTDPALTTQVAGASAGTPNVFYPKGVRNFVRLAAPDQYQGAAAAMFASEHHLHRVYVLDDGEPYGSNLAQWFKDDGARLHVGAAGSATWNPQAKDYTSLAAQVARAHPDGVYLAGFGFLHGTKVLKTLRPALGSKVVVFAPDGFVDAQEDKAEAGSAADGLYVTLAMFPPEAASPHGKQILEQSGREPPLQYGSLFGAAAAAAMLKAIAASDGSRTSVTRQLFRVETPAGLIGPGVGFNRNGDPTRGAMAVYRVANGKLFLAQMLYPTSTAAEG
jgi:branched-chain amino acid transport system substrate-binding protein